MQKLKHQVLETSFAIQAYEAHVYSGFVTIVFMLFRGFKSTADEIDTKQSFRPPFYFIMLI